MTDQARDVDGIQCNHKHLQIIEITILLMWFHLTKPRLNVIEAQKQLKHSQTAGTQKQNLDTDSKVKRLFVSMHCL